MIKRFAAMLTLVAGLSACGAVEVPSRNAPLDLPGPMAAGPTDVARNYTLGGINVVVPQALRVSERNGYYPMADIVWRGDPVGDRHAQVADLFRTAAARSAGQMTGPREVVVDIVLVRFHGVTERTRYSVGGVYNIVFDMTVRDAATGAVIEPARRIEANLPAPGGQAAVELERIGQTERVRVTDFLAFTLLRELGQGAGPTGLVMARAPAGPG